MNKYEHILLPNVLKQDLRYTSRQTGRDSSKIPERDRVTHADDLHRKLSAVWSNNSIITSERSAVSLPTRSGIYIEFKGANNYDLAYKSLENLKAGIRLLNVRNIVTNEGQETLATVYLPQGKEKIFIKKLEEYSTLDTVTGKPKNDKLFRSIEDIKIAVLENMWTDSENLFPTEHDDWYEVWIRTNDDGDLDSQHGKFEELLVTLNIQYKENVLHFPERSVFMIYANKGIFIELLNRSDQLAEIKSGQETSGFWYNAPRADQREWIDDLLDRLIVENQSSVCVCVLDTGVNNGHPLLAPFFTDDRCLTNFPNEGTADRVGHGTQMSGIVALGDLETDLLSRNAINVNHKLCSVKILPNQNDNRKELWGKITEESISRAEIALPNEKIIYCMAITAFDCENRGKPSSWSGAVDKISYNSGDKTRLFILSAGNVQPNSVNYSIWNDYPKGNMLKEIQNPAQSWNALTIGAYTNKQALDSQRLSGFSRVAESGGISPFSTTSILWVKSSPIKPEVMFEGGNLYKSLDPDFPYSTDEDLEVLTTNHHFQVKLFDVIAATSAATAFAANFAARLMVKYPNLWPESIRGLMVHSAKWTDAMIAQFPVNNNSRAQMGQRLRCCGYGVPSEERAFYSTENGFTYIAQEVLRPFIKDRKQNYVKFNQMNFYDLPWPKELLESLQEIDVSLRITLSYFIEPGPGEIGWKDKYRYASCGLRFDVNQEVENEEMFKLRINKLMQADEENESIPNDSQRWLIGKNNRDQGSVHSDVLNLTAAQLSSCNKIAVFPVGGWWRTRTNLHKYNSDIRYSLIVSLDTPKEDVDLYNVVKTKIDTLVNIPVAVKVTVNN
jgi:hypothetical protein